MIIKPFFVRCLESTSESSESVYHKSTMVEKIYPAEEEKSNVAGLRGVARLVGKMKNGRKERKIGWGLSEFKGVERQLGLSLASFVCVATVSMFACVRQYQLYDRDLNGGVRCSKCSVRYYLLGAIGASATAWWGLSMTVAKVTGWYTWRFSGSLIKSCQCSLHYELGQAVVTGFAICNWLAGLGDLAMIDLRGDPMHLMYIPFGRKHYSIENPYTDNNPLGLRKFRQLERFLGIEYFVTWSVALSAISIAFWRIACERTHYQFKLWGLLDFIEIGTILSTAYPRIMDDFGWTGTNFNGYSPFVIFGAFRFLRLLRLERLLYSLFSYEGVKRAGWNGVHVQYGLLLFKLFVGIATLAAVICAIEYPCEPNALRLELHLQLDNCNRWFRRYDMCIYFLFVTLATIGYGDLYPATLPGRILMMMVLLFILAIFPALTAHLTELSDGDDISQEEYSLSCVTAIWEEMAILNRKIDDILAQERRSRQLLLLRSRVEEEDDTHLEKIVTRMQERITEIERRQMTRNVSKRRSEPAEL